MKWNLDFILIFLSFKLVSMLNITEETNIHVTENAKVNSEFDKIIQGQTNLIKQIMSSDESSTTTGIEKPLKNKNQEDEKNEENYDIQREEDMGKLRINGITVDDILKRCKEITNDKVQSDLKKNGNSNANFINENIKVTDYVSSLQHVANMNSQEAQNNFLQALNVPNFSYMDLITQYYANKKENENLNKFQSSPNNVLQKIMYQQQHEHSFNHAPIQEPLQPNIKPIKLVPTILQKVSLDNGQIIYYWNNAPDSYKSPTYMQQLPTANKQTTQLDQQAQASQNANNLQQGISHEGRPHVSPSYSVIAQALNKTDSKQSAKTDTERKADNVPHYEIKYGTDLHPNQETNIKQPSKANYEQQLKFVIPHVNNCKEELPVRYAGQFDPYAYLPKSMQPSEINVRVPYTPTFHMIKSLMVPGNIQIDDTKIQTKK